MFTGIVAAIGRITSVRPLAGEPGAHAVGSRAADSNAVGADAVGSGAMVSGEAGPGGAGSGGAGRSKAAGPAGLRLRIDARGLDLADVALGDSIALQGACMTVVALDGPGFEVDVSAESLARTVGLERPGAVNLEKALRMGDRLGGHMVSGHVDGVGEVVSIEPQGESRRFELTVPSALGRYLAPKGSVTVDGVSLTVNTVIDEPSGSRISINLIPHTMAVTTLGERRAGDRVNIEVDLIARHVERLLGERAQIQTQTQTATAATATSAATAATAVPAAASVAVPVGTVGEGESS